mmetsp:Transcript_4794/g.17951  ORF Transcript_4794/g.17951 Transcript_4794/m.17951 type:complete len:322 (-) Transcript_4794:1249-2214(-)
MRPVRGHEGGEARQDVRDRRQGEDASGRAVVAGRRGGRIVADHPGPGAPGRGDRRGRERDRLPEQGRRERGRGGRWRRREPRTSARPWREPPTSKRDDRQGHRDQERQRDGARGGRRGRVPVPARRQHRHAPPPRAGPRQAEGARVEAGVARANVHRLDAVVPGQRRGVRGERVRRLAARAFTRAAREVRRGPSPGHPRRPDLRRVPGVVHEPGPHRRFRRRRLGSTRAGAGGDVLRGEQGRVPPGRPKRRRHPRTRRRRAPGRQGMLEPPQGRRVDASVGYPTRRVLRSGDSRAGHRRRRRARRDGFSRLLRTRTDAVRV